MLKNYKSFELLEQYLSYLTVIKGRSINTVIEYRTDVLMFFEFLCNKRNMEREKYDLSMIDKLMSNSLHIFHTKDSCDNIFIRLINGGIFNVQR